MQNGVMRSFRNLLFFTFIMSRTSFNAKKHSFAALIFMAIYYSTVKRLLASYHWAFSRSPLFAITVGDAVMKPFCTYTITCLCDNFLKRSS